MRQKVVEYTIEVIKSIAISGGKEISIVNEGDSIIGKRMLDSLGFIELICALEEKYNIEVDLDEIDPEVFTTLGGLVEVVVSAINKNN